MCTFSGNSPTGSRGTAERSRNFSNLISGINMTIILDMAHHLQWFSKLKFWLSTLFLFQMSNVTIWLLWRFPSRSFETRRSLLSDSPLNERVHLVHYDVEWGGALIATPFQAQKVLIGYKVWGIFKRQSVEVAIETKLEFGHSEDWEPSLVVNKLVHVRTNFI